MKKTFVCPHCRGVLNPNVKILLVADTGKDRAWSCSARNRATPSTCATPAWVRSSAPVP